MRKRGLFFYAICLGSILWGAQGAFCLHNLLLDNQKVDTVSVGEQFLLSLSLEREGGRVGAEIWMDLDGDGKIERSRDFLVTSGEGLFVDGGPNDLDGLRNGSLSQTIKGYWPIPGHFIFRAWEDGIGDSAYLLQVPAHSRYSISGMVVNPPAREKLMVYASLGEANFPAGGVTYLAFTDLNGDYRIWVPESLGVQRWLVGSVDLLGIAPGYIPPEPRQLRVDGEITGVNLAYQRATARVQGRVMDQEGEAVPQVRITSTQEGGGLTPSALSDSLGDYLLEVKGGRWTIAPDPECLIPKYLVPEPRRLRVEDGDTLLLDFVCFRAKGTISGTVYVNNGDPAEIEVKGWTDLSWTSTFTDTSGAYSLPVADSLGRYSLRVFPPKGWWAREGQVNGIKVGKGEVNFHLLPADASLQGWVNNEEGKGIPQAQISAWGESGSFSTQTDSQGHYRIYLPAGTYNLRAQKEGYQAEVKRNVLFSGTDLTLNFSLKELPGVVSGYVYTSDGSPLRWAWITAIGSTPGENFSTETDWSGWYRLSIPYSQLSLIATAPGYDEKEERGITLSPSHPDTELDFHLSPIGVTREPYAPLPPLVFPHPFSQEESIRFLLKGRGEKQVRVSIYNLEGEEIKLIYTGQLPPGPYQFTWRGRNEEGEELKNGLYFLKLDVGGKRAIKKIFLIR